MAGITQEALRRGVSGLALVIGVSAAAPALAQSAPAGVASARQVETVIVTARKREETVQDAPLTVKAFSEDQLAARGIDGIADLARNAPGINFIPGNSRISSTISVRGMTQVSAVGDNRRDLVTVFIDGVPYVGNPSGVGLEDLARVEVIKGPQSALFGRATFGGAISMITTTPGSEFEARVSATVADFGDMRLSGRIEGPIFGDILSGGLSGEVTTFDGMYGNTEGGKLGASEGSVGTGTLVFRPIPALQIKARASVRRDGDGPAASVLGARWPTHNCGPFPGFLARPLAGLPPEINTVALARRTFCGALSTPPGPYTINTRLPQASITPVRRTKLENHGLVLDYSLYTLTADWEVFGGHTISAIASTQDQVINVLQDFERAPEDRYQASISNQQLQDFFEVRLTSPSDQRLTWMVGASSIQQEFNSLGQFVNGALFGPAAGGPPGLPVRALNTQENQAVFASLAFDITDSLNLSLEARRQEETLAAGIGTPTRFEATTEATLPRVILRYELSDRTNVYANYAEGNQPTSGNPDFFALTPAGRAVAERNGVVGVLDEAKLKSFEIGLKHLSADGSWYANVSAYRMEWIGRQGVRTIQVDVNGDGVINLTGTGVNREVFNAAPFAAGDSETTGAEIDAGWNPTDRISLGGTLAYADTEITKALNEALLLRFFNLADGKGREYPNAPKLSGAAFAEYSAPAMGDLDWFARADVTYVSKRYDSILNLTYVPDLWRTNARLGLRSDRWEASFWVNNLFDDDTPESASYNSDSAADPFFFQLAASEIVLPRKRQIGLTVTVRR
jgi:iron complex outermembrane receptor protein